MMEPARLFTRADVDLLRNSVVADDESPAFRIQRAIDDLADRIDEWLILYGDPSAEPPQGTMLGTDAVE